MPTNLPSRPGPRPGGPAGLGPPRLPIWTVAPLLRPAPTRRSLNSSPGSVIDAESCQNFHPNPEVLSMETLAGPEPARPADPATIRGPRAPDGALEEPRRRL